MFVLTWQQQKNNNSASRRVIVSEKAKTPFSTPKIFYISYTLFKPSTSSGPCYQSSQKSSIFSPVKVIYEILNIPKFEIVE